MTALFESFSLTIILDVFSLSILTLLHFSWVRKPVLDRNLDMMDPIFFGEVPHCSMNAGPLSVMTSATPPQQQKISSKMKSLRVFSFSFRSGHHSAHHNSAQCAWTR